MKKLASAITFLALFVLAASARAQSETYSTITSVPGAEVENRIEVTDAAPLAAMSPDACTQNATTLCLNNGRFQVRAIFSTASITNGPAQAVPLTGDTGYFWFFSANNVEITLKVVDGRTFNGFFWAFYAALSDVAYTITITDMDTGAVKTYSNPQGSLSSVADVAAFAGTSPTCSYAVSPSTRTVGSGGGTGTFSVATAGGCSWSATSNATWISVTSGSSGSGNGTVNFSAASNTSSSVRTGTLNVAGQLVYVEQAGTSSGGDYNGSWNGTTSQGRPISFTIASNRLQSFSIGYSVSGGGCSSTGTNTITYTTPPSVSSAGFVVSIIGVGNPRLSYTATVNFNSTSSASGNASFTFTQTSPLPACNATGSATYSLTKS
ncbi:MAG: BACON domain-containing carbohydrate-binding protein [Acidobacteriota bacterium]